MNNYYEIIGIAFGEESLQEISQREGIRTINIPISRKISLWEDFQSLALLISLFIKEKPYIVHANTPKASLLSMIAAWITGVPHRVYTVTGLRFETTTGNLRRLLVIMEK